jgi:hypothetical protein
MKNTIVKYPINQSELLKMKKLTPNPSGMESANLTPKNQFLINSIY